MEQTVGIVGLGIYLPQTKMTAKEISQATAGAWSEEAVINKLGIVEKYVPSGETCDGTQEMGALAALDCLKNTGVDPLDIDAILCITEEWKEYPLTTSACYVQDRIGARNAWGIDVQNRCCTCVSAMKIAKDMLLADEEMDTVLVCGGYRNCDLIDYTDKNLSFMYDLACGGGYPAEEGLWKKPAAGDSPDERWVGGSHLRRRGRRHLQPPHCGEYGNSTACA